MAIKGKSYIKTTWAFEERPVASSKLNSWDDRIEGALELAYRLLSLAWGGGDGVLRGATTDDLKVVESAPPSLSVMVQAGFAIISNFPYKIDAATQTADVVAPTVDPRIDLVVARLNTWDVLIKTGTESATPVAPVADADTIPLAELFLRPGMTTLLDIDDSTNGFITDVRLFL